jgi:sulfate adenylyltransferase subunit 2
VRIHPLLHWTEIDIWHYTKREEIPIVNLYFAKDGKRYRSLGCVPCTFPIDSQADTLDKVIAELEASKTSERAGRATDQEAEDAFEQLRLSGHM